VPVPVDRSPRRIAARSIAATVVGSASTNAVIWRLAARTPANDASAITIAAPSTAAARGRRQRMNTSTSGSTAYASRMLTSTGAAKRRISRSTKSVAAATTSIVAVPRTEIVPLGATVAVAPPRISSMPHGGSIAMPARGRRLKYHVGGRSVPGTCQARA